MKRLGVQIKMENDAANIFDKVIDSGTTSSGLYLIPIKYCNIPIKEVDFAIEDKSYI